VLHICIYDISRLRVKSPRDAAYDLTLAEGGAELSNDDYLSSRITKRLTPRILCSSLSFNVTRRHWLNDAIYQMNGTSKRTSAKG